MLPPQILAFGSYMLAQHLLKEKAFKNSGIEELLGPQLVSWLPAIIGLVAFILGNKFQQGAAKKATAALIGERAPDFSFDVRNDDNIVAGNTLTQLVESTKLPVIVDFYQNF